jgi:hypothetical protein
MPTKPRLATTTIWALEDIIAELHSARQRCRQAIERAAETRDTAQLAALARLTDSLATIEAAARDARNGRYQQKGP